MDEADGAPSPRPPLRERSPGTAGEQRGEARGAGDGGAAAGKSTADAPPNRRLKKAKRVHVKDERSAEDELDSALDALQEVSSAVMDTALVPAPF